MNIEPLVGIGKFKLGVELSDPLWSEIGEYLPFQRNYLQKNPSIRFPTDRVIVYFDNKNMSAAVEVLGNLALYKDSNLIGLSVKQAKILLGESENRLSYDGDVLTSDTLKISLYIVKRANKRVVGSILSFNESYLNDNDLIDEM